MSDDSDRDEDPPHLARYREYKRRQELKRQNKSKQSPNNPTLSPDCNLEQPDSIINTLFNHRFTPLILKLIIWTFLLLFFAHHEFGSVFFVASIPVIVWLSMEEYKRGPRELSAYSVFNDNVERLDGTFTSEQWERELRYGPASVMKRE